MSILSSRSSSNIGSPITGLSIHDPFAIAGFVFLVIVVIVAMIMLTVTARRSAESIWDGIHYDARFRSLRQARQSAILATSNTVRQSLRTDESVAGTPKRVSFMLRQSPRKSQTPAAPMTPASPYTPNTPSSLRIAMFAESVPFLPASPIRKQRVRMRGEATSTLDMEVEDACRRWSALGTPPRDCFTSVGIASVEC
ncbi:hypothetical protein BAUCODRAFT_239265 [Baudoinia panamericana UAMH 10762]|uniref:Uncharacterized protein n=1 Tax=Baudoinia panamericana (strain UAMH 10762) TaxID=717646 RepID=M2N337_BAUPA|nr:uncharacterized protein BAUCODRAFT_239265 [Baudoinia panamericana UAMH 10762]EMC93394.1 hypothetical protein BAUCODRAFT_239265 [Baudoinia panamericana UAMH 10762]